MNTHHPSILRALIAAASLAGLVAVPACRQATVSSGPSVFNRPPLAETPYATLPLDAIEPAGWLREMLVRMANGMTGHLDELYPTLGESNGWIGGDGDSWERGPYWLDGLLPLAYILKDERLVEKARPYIEWTLASQRPDGYFGPEPEPDGTENRPQEQRINRADWWPRMIMLKVLQSHFEATGDERVLDLMTRYFEYQAGRLTVEPLGHWTGWGMARGGENQASIYWLYNRTGNGSLLDLAETVFDQTSDWTDDFLSGLNAEEYWRTHVVNVAMGIKQPAIQYLQSKEKKHLDAVYEGLDALMDRHGQVFGMFSGDELLHGTDPTRGTELCAVVEFMYSLETLMAITGDVAFADRLEKVAYNALPTQVLPDQSARQYFQRVNQVRASIGEGKLFFDNYTDATCWGLLTGYPCCTTNMHQGWPRFTRHLWLASGDDGLAAMTYAPSAVTATVGEEGVRVRIVEETDYPFGDDIRFLIDTEEPVAFPLHLRIPTWADGASIEINGEASDPPTPGEMVILHRDWADGDAILLRLPSEVRLTRGHRNSVSVERGPLVYSLHIEGESRLAEAIHTDTHVEMHPTADWNYGLVFDQDDPAASFPLVRTEMSDYPWTPDTVPITILATGIRLRSWQEDSGAAGPLPLSPVYVGPEAERVENLRLIPYGASTLRIAAFPEARR